MASRLEKTPSLNDDFGEERDVNTVSEKTRLLPRSDIPPNSDITSTQQQTFEYRFYITMSIILIAFKGCEEMASVTLKQFVYSWCQNETVSTENFSSSDNAHGDNSTDNCGHKGSKATESEAQKLASRWELYFNLLNAVLVFFSVSAYGTLSDYFGRKPFLCNACLGYALRCGIIAAVIYFDLHVAWILLAYGVDGVCGSSFAVSLFAYACTADVTQRSGSRVLAIAGMEAILGVGKLTTQFGNGYFIHQYGYFYPMFTSAAGVFFSFVFTWLAFKETNNAKDPSQTRQHYPRCTTLISRYTTFYLKTGTKKDKIVFWLCLIVFVLFEISLQGRSDPLVLYQLVSPFCWSSEEIGWYGAVSVFLWYVLGCLLLKPLQFCMSANTISCFGIVSSIAMYVVTGLAPSSLWIFIATGFGLILILPKPILRALASTRASETEQGAMFAGLQSSELICRMVSSPLSLSIYSASLDTMKGMVFLVLAGIDGLALVFMIKSSNCKNAIYNKKGKTCYFSDQHYSVLTKFQDITWNIFSVNTEPWSFVFIARPGLSVDIADAWEVGGPGTTDSPTCISTFENCSGYFRHKGLNYWENVWVSEVRFSYWSQGAEAGFIVFNGTGSDITNWFSSSRILYSSWENVAALCPCSDFKIKGRFGRRFVISTQYNGCINDKGYSMIIQEPSKICDFGQTQAFYFSSLTGPSIFEGDDTVQADFMSIQIKSGQ